jgi:hypothetical protein
MTPQTAPHPSLAFGEGLGYHGSSALCHQEQPIYLRRFVITFTPDDEISRVISGYYKSQCLHQFCSDHLANGAA